MIYFYYLHFKDAVSPSVLDALSDSGASVTPVFDTSYLIDTELSHGQLKRIIKAAPDLSPCVLMKLKQSSEFSRLLQDANP